MNKIVLVVFIFCVCQGINAFCTTRCGEPTTRCGCETCTSYPTKECETCRDTTPCSTCTNKCKCNSYLDPECECFKATGIDAFCTRGCGKPTTRCGCETCTSCPIKECETCRDTTPCSTCMNKCKCNSYLDPECECLKAMVRFPDVEYPMSIAEIKPYYSGYRYL
ncbi:unnamed protein product, partial [Brenthis ino]